MNELEMWYEQISKYERLSLSQAQELYKEVISLEDPNEKKKLMNRIILGTLYVVYNYIKNNNLIIFETPSYDIGDIINSYNEIWIKKIYEGELLNIDTFSNLLNGKFRYEACVGICGNNNKLKSQLDIEISDFIPLFLQYVEYKNSGSSEPFKPQLNESCKNLSKMLILIENIYNNLNFDKTEDLELSEANIKPLIALLINTGITNTMPNEYPDSRDMVDELSFQTSFRKYFVQMSNLFGGTRNFHIFCEGIGVPNGYPTNIHEIARKYNITPERVRQIKKTIYDKIKHPKYLRNYRDDFECRCKLTR